MPFLFTETTHRIALLPWLLRRMPLPILLRLLNLCERHNWRIGVPPAS